jgi:hypothetical protein
MPPRRVSAAGWWGASENSGERLADSSPMPTPGLQSRVTPSAPPPGVPGTPASIVDPPRSGQSPGGLAASVGPPTLSPEHLAELTEARRRGRKIRRTVGTAKLSGWTTGIFGALSVAISLVSFSGSGLLLGLALVASSCVELRNAGALARLDESAPGRLALNQVALIGVLTLYSLWSIYVTLTSPSAIGAELAGSPDMDQLVGSVAGLERTITVGVYGGVIVASVIFQGGLAWYYAARGRALRAYIAQTPEWVVAWERASAGA